MCDRQKLKIWAKPSRFFVYIRLFHTTQFKYKLIKSKMVCLELEPGAAGWKAQLNPLNYGGTQTKVWQQILDRTKVRFKICFFRHLLSFAFLSIRAFMLSRWTRRGEQGVGGCFVVGQTSKRFCTSINEVQLLLLLSMSAQFDQRNENKSVRIKYLNFMGKWLWRSCWTFIYC